MMNFKCLNCSDQLEEDEDICEKCFETMPMDIWVQPTKINKKGEWSNE